MTDEEGNQEFLVRIRETPQSKHGYPFSEGSRFRV